MSMARTASGAETLRRRTVLVRSLGALVALAAAVVLASCAPAPQPSVAPPAATQPIEAMTPSAKRATIATSFPAEVPVPVGDFTRAQAQGDDAWDYVVEVDATPTDVVAWYRGAYTARQWWLVKEGDFDAEDGGGTFLDFKKNRAQSSVMVYGDDSAGFTRVRVTVGVGTPVLETQ